MINKIKNHFGMKHIPFSKSLSTKELFVPSSLLALEQRLSLAIRTEDFALVSGSAGSGKSSAIRYFISNVDPSSYPCIYLTAENYKITHIAKLILQGLKVEIPYDGYTALRKVKSHIKKIYDENNIKPIIVIDEAQDLPIATLSSIKNLTNFKMDSQSRMTIILVGQSQLLNKINMAELASLRRRIRVRYKFENLSVEDTIKFISHQLKVAGLTKEIFSEETKAEIFRLSNGVISNINNICYDLLIGAVENSMDFIEPSLLKNILSED